MQAGVDVLAVIIHLLRVEGALAVQTVQRLSEFDQLRLTPLTIHTLVTDVLHTHTHSRPSAHTHTPDRRRHTPAAQYLSDELQHLRVCVGGTEGTDGLQPPQVPLDLPLLLLQRQAAVGDQRLVPLHLLWGPCVSLSALMHHPAVLHLLNTHDTLFRFYMKLMKDLRSQISPENTQFNTHTHKKQYHQFLII